MERYASRAVLQERRLGPVAVMRVVIHHQHAACPALQQVARRDGDIVENAEAHGARGFGVMTRRADQGERVGSLPRPDRAGALQGAACRQQGGIKGGARDVCRGIIDDAPALRAR